MKLRKNRARLSAPPDMCLLILCICFLIGMLAAWPVHRGISSEALTQLSAYVQSYAQLSDGRVQQPASVLSTAAAYLRCPLLAFLCGLSAAGAVLIPALCMVQGFCLSFSVCCFAASLGHEGVLLALAALFAPVFLQSIAYTLVFAAAGVIAGATGQKPCAQLCRLYFEGARLCGSVLVLYFFMIFLSTALLLLAGNGG